MSLKVEKTITAAVAAKDIAKCSVTKATVLSQGKNALVLKTAAPLVFRKELSSGDPAMFDQSTLGKVGQTVEGRLCIEAVSDDVVRVRYCEGVEVLTNDTDMVVGVLPPPRACDIRMPGNPDAASKEPIVMRTAALQIRVSLNPYRLEITDLDGHLVCGVGGPEKDYFSVMDSLNTGIARHGQTGAPIAVENFDLQYDEAIYGLGEKFMGLNKVGQVIELNMKDAVGVTTPRSYKNVPFFVSSRGYGVFFNHSSLMQYWLGAMSAVDVQVAAEDDFLDYYIFVGSIKQVLSWYTDLTGKGCLPPAWTFGYWQSKISYSSAAETLEIAHKMREHGVPCDVIHLDTFWFEKDWLCDLQFAKDRFPDPAAYLKELAGLGFKVSLWQIPYIPEGSQLFDDLLAVDGFVKTADGGLAPGGFCFTRGFTGRVGIIDYSNPRAVKVHQDYFRTLFRLGAKVIKTDFGEAAPVDGVYANGRPGRQNHNLYPLLYNRALFEVTKEETGDGVVWARSAWAGSQRYPLHWGGDNSPNYMNMQPQLAGGLSFGLSGFQFWSQDIGGFLGTTNDRLLIRWMQVGMFISHSRIHGCGDRELYKFAPETLRICRSYIRLRYRLMPYIYGQAADAVAQSLPLLRALVIEYQDDPTVRNLADQYLFGDSLLVAPIFSEDNRRRVYLPQGVWTDWWTGHRTTGPVWLDVEAGLETLPLYIREGAVIPVGPVMNYVGETPVTRIELLVAKFADSGRTRIRVPVNGEWVSVEYVAKHGKHNLSIGRSDVVFDVKLLGKGPALAMD